MTMTPRQRAIERIAQTPYPQPQVHAPIPDIFGSNVFSVQVMRERLPVDVYESIERTIGGESRLDESVADTVADAMKAWALERGATHYAHVFFPLTGLTAEKHDSFYEPDGKGQTIAAFSGKALIQGESDASSFPSGGIRQTFEARGYTAWDVSSPAYLYEGIDGATLCIPTAFISWTGEALDKKTPVLRSMQALDRQTRRVLRLFGHKNTARVQASCGPEQEYFLIDRNFYYLRPDLMHTGRALFGAAPPKGQEFEDHYFGAIPDRVLAYMAEVEIELFKLGIPAKTRHNEVAPSQYEIAPIFEDANIATDHQMLTMMTLNRIAPKHGFVCLTHEKPFTGVNGSGKHVNWSLGNSTQGNLLDPGETPHDNAQFLVFCAAVVRGVHRWGHLLRAVIASAGNDHRLGANEAPPAILSVFLGEPLTDIFSAIAGGEGASGQPIQTLRIGVDVLPDLPQDAGDRNRTSPFAFVGNRFEFRSVGSNQSIAGPLVAINTIVAESLDYCADRLEAANATTKAEFNAAVQNLLRDIWLETQSIVFNGDGYSSDWQKEAARRNIPNARTTPDSLPALVDEHVLDLFEQYDILSRRELKSRYEIYVEQYVKQVNVEVRTTLKIAKTMILPAALRFAAELADHEVKLRAAGQNSASSVLRSGLADRISTGVSALIQAIESLEHGLIHDPFDSIEAEMNYYRDTLIPAMAHIRFYADALELEMDDSLWPLPTFHEMLFMK